MTFDGPTTEAACYLPAEQRSGRQPGSPWLTTELAVLRQHYGSGAKVVHALLPHRTLCCIRAKASSEGIKGNRNTTLGMRWSTNYTTRPDIDQAIREGYIHATAKGDIKRLAERLQRPAWWVQKRAAALGVTRSNRTRLDAWKPEEVAILERYAAAGLDVIATKLRQAGHSRTATAVAMQLKRRQIDRTDPDVWSATQLGPLFGVNPTTVVDWIQRRGLPAKKWGDGATNRYMVHRRDLRRWVARNANYVDHRRLDWPWFCELIFGASS
jgi:hypothetical protein